MPLFLHWAARLARRETSLSRRATSAIPTSLHFFLAGELNIRCAITKTIRIEAEEPHEPIDILIVSLCHLHLTLWQVENTGCSRSGCRGGITLMRSTEITHFLKPHRVLFPAILDETELVGKN